MLIRTVVLAATLLLAPLATRAADLVVWWEKGFYEQEDQAVREIIAEFEGKTGKTVELVQHRQGELSGKALAAVEAGQPPDFLFGMTVPRYFGQRAEEDRLVDLTEAIGQLAILFDQDALDKGRLFNRATGRRSLYSLPVGRMPNSIHVWKSLLAQAGSKLEDIPKEWEPFWAFWCDKVQPAVRKATGRDDIWGVGLSMSEARLDTEAQFRQFVAAYEADYVTRDGRLIIDEPLVRNRLAKSLESYTAIFRKGCAPPDSLTWDGGGNNTAFLAQAIVMTANGTLSIPGALRAARPEDYRENTATIEWPSGAYGQPLSINTSFYDAVVFESGGHVATAKEFVRFLVEDGWLAHWLDFAGDRFHPPMTALLNMPFWLDTSDRHRMISAIQFLTKPRDYSENYDSISGEWRHRRVWAEGVWPKAVHRVATGEATPEQAVDEAIARIKQILSE